MLTTLEKAYLDAVATFLTTWGGRGVDANTLLAGLALGASKIIAPQMVAAYNLADDTQHALTIYGDLVRELTYAHIRWLDEDH